MIQIPARTSSIATTVITKGSGLIDRTGKWTFQPEHEDIHIGARNMWYIRDNIKCGVIDTNGQLAIPMEFEDVRIHPDNGITITKDDHSQSRYDYDGTLLDEFVFDEIYNLAYYINEFDDEGYQKQAVDNMLKYSAGNYCGLITKKRCSHHSSVIFGDRSCGFWSVSMPYPGNI